MRVYRLVGLQDGVEMFSIPVVPRHGTHIACGVWHIGAVAVAEASILHVMGVTAGTIRRSEDGADLAPGEFSSVEAA